VQIKVADGVSPSDSTPIALVGKSKGTTARKLTSDG
jgi:hypothetical protein